MKIQIKGVLKELKRIEDEQKKEMDKQLMKTATDLLSSLKSATPKDTGEAAAGWKLEKAKRSVDLVNDVEHLPLLNEGHSQQAPKRFIERTALMYGVPEGSIVQKS